jgi:hypothetical protein
VTSKHHNAKKINEKAATLFDSEKRKSNTFAKTTGMAQVIVFGTMKIK